MTLSVGEGSKREQCRLLSSLPVFSHFPSTHNQIGPFWCLFQGDWACVHSRTLWVSPMNSPVRLGVSPTVASTPTGVFNQRFEALFPHSGALGCGSVSLPSCSFHFVCMQKWDHRVHQTLSCYAPAPSWLPVSTPPTNLGECFFFNSLVVGLPHSSIF